MLKRPPSYTVELIINPAVQQISPYPEALAQLFNTQTNEAALEVITSWPGYAPTPLRELSHLAQSLDLAAIHYKDESTRMGLGSFKPLGGAYAVQRLLMREIERVSGETNITNADILNGKYAHIVENITVTSATDGNHGRSVAWGAKMAGCRCVIYVHETVSVARERAIARFGAEVRRVEGIYDDAVRAARNTAKEQSWFVIQDTVDVDDIQSTLEIMHGYTLLASESIAQLGDRGAPTHVFLQAGVGGMAAAVLAQLWVTYGEERPRVIIVEPDKAACCLLSLQAGKPTIAPGSLDSIMAGLACGEISSLAWQVLQPGAFAAAQVGDDDVADCMRLLADNRYGDGAIVAGESAVAGLVALIAIAQDQSARGKIGLDENSRVLLIGSEGATDPEVYAGIVGRSAEEVHD